MYYDYFGLNQPPFRITPDTSLFFPGGNRGAILNAMIYAITSGEGIVKVVGEVGSGKTMLCRMLSVELPANVEIVYLANPSLSPDDILQAIAFELKLPVAPGEDRLRVMHKLQEYLLQRHAENRQVVVFVEEAQGMPLATLEEIRLLSNLETQQHKLLQIVLFGQPELDQMIARREIRQLKERITYSFYLNPLKKDEIRDYLNTRLRACGYRTGDAFNTAAIRTISQYSKGLLRRINILADKAMLAAYASNTHKVTARHVRTAAEDSEFVASWQRYRRVATFMGAVIVLLLAVWLLPIGQIIEKFTGTGLVADPLTTEDAALQKSTPETGGRVTVITGEQEREVITLYQPQDATEYYDYLSAGTSPGGNTNPDINSGDGGLLRLDEELHHPDSTAQDINSGDVGAAVADNSSNAVTPVEKVQQSTASRGPADRQLADNLLDEGHYAQIVDLGESSLTSEEADRLKQQLKLLPPETASEMQPRTECKLCTSIIYRPLIKEENL